MNLICLDRVEIEMIDKKAIISTLRECAALYQQNLVNRNFLFVGRHNKNGNYQCIETVFKKQNFMHLTGVTGVIPVAETEECDSVVVKARKMSATHFFELCVDGRISADNILVDDPYQVESKLLVLPAMMRVPWTATMMGSFNRNGNFLVTEHVAGHINGCVGFKAMEHTPFLVPNTVLNGDARQYMTDVAQVLATYSKDINDSKYASAPLYVAKSLRNSTLKWPNDIEELIAKENSPH